MKIVTYILSVIDVFINPTGRIDKITFTYAALSLFILGLITYFNILDENSGLYFLAIAYSLFSLTVKRTNDITGGQNNNKGMPKKAEELNITPIVAPEAYDVELFIANGKNDVFSPKREPNYKEKKDGSLFFLIICLILFVILEII